MESFLLDKKELQSNKRGGFVDNFGVGCCYIPRIFLHNAVGNKGVDGGDAGAVRSFNGTKNLSNFCILLINRSWNRNTLISHHLF